MRLSCHKGPQQCRRVGEIEDPGPARPHRDGKPDRPLGQPQAQLARVPGRVPQPDAGVPVALDPAFGQDEQVRPDRLRAGIAAPDPPQHRGKQEQPQPRHDEQTGDKIELVRPDLDPEEEEPPPRQVHQHGLVRQFRTPVPADPGQQVIDPQGHRHDDPFEVAETALHPARKDRLVRGEQGLRVGMGHDAFLVRSRVRATAPPKGGPPGLPAVMPGSGASWGDVSRPAATSGSGRRPASRTGPRPPKGPRTTEGAEAKGGDQ